MKTFNLLSIKFKKQINNYFIKNTFPHTILINSSSDLENYQASLYIACRLLCLEKDFCEGKCNNCLRVLNNKYSDFLILNNKDISFKKEQVNELIKKMSFTALEPLGKKVYLIQNIEISSLEASNGLLKFLEEPSNNTYAIITTKNINSVLNTIISRSQIINLLVLNKDKFKEIIQKNLEYELEDAILLSNCFDNLEQVNILEKENYFLIKSLVFQFFENYLNKNFDENYLLSRKIIKLDKDNLYLF